ncbi:MAG: DUF3107 family protein [Acidimicrobiia bacterium]|nr:DUF3107 family protein [Acidimicrobiia bacterium]
MSNGGRMRIGIEGAREIEIEVEDVKSAAKDLEAGLTEKAIVWITDTKGDQHGIVSARLAFVEVEETRDRPVGFGY